MARMKAEDFDDNGIRIRRSRRSESGFDAKEIAERVCKFARDDEDARSKDMDSRKQRYAKFRMWTDGGGDWPWEGSSDVALPGMMTDVLAMEDTLHNAAMSNRPIVTSRAVTKRDQEKQDLIDELIDTQLFIEQPGEKIIEEAADAFVQDGVFTAFVPWITEDRKITLRRTFEGLEPNDTPLLRFRDILKQAYPDKEITQQDEQGWDWKVVDTETKLSWDVSFYTDEEHDEIEMISSGMSRVFDGPRVLVKDYEDVLTPPRTANLQAPGPSNPGGATHVILIDYPSLDEIERLVEDGTYDIVSKKDMDNIRARCGVEETDHGDKREQLDAFQGKEKRHNKNSEDRSHNTLTRYICFDLYDVDDDGINVDMMWWVLKEPKLLLRAKRMTEMYPIEPPRRPLAEATFIPVKDRREGIGLLEMIESMNDFKKELLDQGVDAGTLANLPFWFYRATSSIKPEVIRLWPGDGYPLPDPKNDVNFPNLGSGNSTSFALNMMSVADQMTEKLTVRGDLQLGRVPIGRSSALRTSQNLQTLMQAGEARPERILRRFFMGLVEIYKQIHELNQQFLPDKKKFRIMGIRNPNDDPYREVSAPSDISGRYQFDFDVNVLNASKIAVQDALEKMMQVFINPIAIQLGIVEPEGVYRMFRDWGKSHGQDVDKYLSPPSPEALSGPIMAEEALTKITMGILPTGRPFEGAEQHFSKLQMFIQSPLARLLDTPDKVALFRQYVDQTRQRIQVEQMAAAAGPMGPGSPGGRPAAGGPPPSLGQPPVQENELMDETLPGAGGGANPGMMA